MVKKQEVRNVSEIKLATCFPPSLPPPATPPTLQEFQDEIAPIQDDVTHMNQLASTFGPHDVQLSPANLDRLDDLNTRWKLLQVRTSPPVCCRRGGKKKPWAHLQMYQGLISIQKLRLLNAAAQMFTGSASSDDSVIIVYPLDNGAFTDGASTAKFLLFRSALLPLRLGSGWFAS